MVRYLFIEQVNYKYYEKSRYFLWLIVVLMFMAIVALSGIIARRIPYSWSEYWEAVKEALRPKPKRKCKNCRYCYNGEYCYHHERNIKRIKQPCGWYEGEPIRRSELRIDSVQLPPPKKNWVS